jgi:peptide/nickel transport system permease protein
MQGLRSTYLRAIGARFLAGVPVFFLVTFAAQGLADLMPGSAALAILGPSATPEQVAILNAQYGFDQPLFERYVSWLLRLLHGDLGVTLFSQQSVAGLLIERAAVTFELAILALGLALIVAIPVALFTAMRTGGIVDGILRGVSSVILSIPSFVIVVMFSFLFAIELRWFPAGGWVSPLQDVPTNLHYAIMPVLCLGIYEMAFFYRLARGEFIATLQEDFILVARAKGLPTTYILLRHVLRPSLTSVLTFFGLSMGRLLGGSFIVESFFVVPGIGWTAVNSVGNKDMPTLQAILLLAVVVYIVVFTLVDIGYALIDPRVSVR